MLKTYALINDNEVKTIKDLEEEELALIGPSYQLIVDIENTFPIPSVGWKLVGNKLIDPQNLQVSLQDTLAYKIKKARQFGEELKGEVIDKIGAKNLILGKTEQQIITVATALLPIGDLMSGGALKTAKSAMIAAKASYPEYESEFDYAISKINEFVGA